jgi:hypothetical protein
MALALNLLTGAGCTLDAGGWARQRGRVELLRDHVVRVDEEGDVVRIEFDSGVDRTLVDDFVATEGVCCSFLALGFDEETRVLRIGSPDPQGLDIARGFAAVFSGGAA